MNGGYALLSLHDVTPAHRARLERAWAWLDRRRLPVRPALLVVPDHHGQWPLDAYPQFVAWLRERAAEGAEIVLHGLRHRADGRPTARTPGAWLRARTLTNGEGEFLTLSAAEAAERLQRGRSVLEDCLGRRPEGFVAPAWLESRGTVAALRTLGFRFHEDHLGIDDLRTGRRCRTPAITFTGRSVLRARASVGWARLIERVLPLPFDLRLALHPVDFDHDALLDAAARLVDAISASRRWVGCREYIDAA